MTVFWLFRYLNTHGTDPGKPVVQDTCDVEHTVFGNQDMSTSEFSRNDPHNFGKFCSFLKCSCRKFVGMAHERHHSRWHMIIISMVNIHHHRRLLFLCEWEYHINRTRLWWLHSGPSSSETYSVIIPQSCFFCFLAFLLLPIFLLLFFFYASSLLASFLLVHSRLAVGQVTSCLRLPSKKKI